MTTFAAIQHLSLPVHDVARARRFYVDFMGLRDGGGEERFAEVFAGDALLALMKSDDAARPRDLHFGFRENSREAVDEWGRKAREAGLVIDFGPGRAEWGGYVVYFRDPEGYQIELWAEHP